MFIINTVQAVIFGLIGVPVGILMTILSEVIIKKKNLEKAETIKPGGKFKVLIYLLTVILWTSAGLFTQKPHIALLVGILFSIAVMFSFIDLRIYIVPNELVLATLIFGVLFQTIYFGIQSLLIAIPCLVGMMLLFLIVALISGMDKVGAGDVKLAGAMGLIIGYPNILIAVLVMCIAIVFYCIYGFFAYRITMKSMLPFAPFMMTGMVAGLLTSINGVLL